MNTVPARHGIVECRHCQFCSPLDEIGNASKLPDVGSCRYGAPSSMPDPVQGNRQVGHWPLVQLVPGNGCRQGMDDRPHPLPPTGPVVS